MPEMDGVEAVRIIREEIGTGYARNIPIIALTANAIVGAEEMFLSNGFQEAISKPIDITKLDKVLRQWVRDRDLEKHKPEEMAKSATAGVKEGIAKGGSVFDCLTIEGMDVDKCLVQLGGDDESLIQVLRAYHTDTRMHLVSLTEQLENRNLDDYAIGVHGIKGASYGICAKRVGSIAKALEIAAKDGDVKMLENKHDPFVKTAGELLDNIGAALQAIDDAMLKPVAPSPDAEVLEELREACKMFDMDGVDKAMARLETFRYEKGAGLTAWLREQIDNMAFEIISDGEWPTEY